MRFHSPILSPNATVTPSGASSTRTTEQRSAADSTYLTAHTARLVEGYFQLVVGDPTNLVDGGLITGNQLLAYAGQDVVVSGATQPSMRTA